MNKKFALSLLAAAVLPAQLQALSLSDTRQQRIIGGVDAAKASYPWMVSVKSKGGSHFCGASLIDKHWVLTAAHCIEDETAAGIEVTIAEYDQNAADEGEQTLAVSAVYMHQQYGDDHDIALLKLSGESDKTPVALADANFMANLAVGTELTAIGWGLTRDGDESSLATVLQQVSVPLYDSSRCKASYGELNIDITSNMVCAGLEAGGKDSCQGDSGGPLFVQSGGSMVQLGVTSFGEACAKAKFPGVYTRVSAYRDWISNVRRGEVPAYQGPGSSGGDTSTGPVLGIPGYVELFSRDQKQVSETLTLNNPAAASGNLLVSDMQIRGDGFSLVENACLNQALEPGKSCQFSVAYQPQTGVKVAEGSLQLTTNHAQHKAIEVELLALNGDAFEPQDGVDCDLLERLNIRRAGEAQCPKPQAKPEAGQNADKPEDSNISLGALGPWSLLGLLLLPLLGRRR